MHESPQNTASPRDEESKNLCGRIVPRDFLLSPKLWRRKVGTRCLVWRHFESDVEEGLLLVLFSAGWTRDHFRPIFLKRCILTFYSQYLYTICILEYNNWIVLF